MLSPAQSRPRARGRTGLEESLWRAGFALWLGLHFATQVWPMEGVLRPLGALGLAGALLLGLGWRDRPAAVLLAVLWLLRPLPHDPWRLDWIVLVLLALQACVPFAPYGTLAGARRLDPGGGWSLPGWIAHARFAALFACSLFVLLPRNGVMLDAVHALDLEALETWLLPLGIAGALLPLCMRAPALGWWWAAFLGAALYVSFEPGKEISRQYLWLALAASFQPGWIPPRAARESEQLFFDGGCALCHGFVRFVLAEDASGTAFRFAPLDSAALRAALPAEERARLPDSLVVRTAQGRVLVRSAAVLHVLQRLGGSWRILGCVLWLVPLPLRDLAYVGLAALRRGLFGRARQACPLLPRHLRARFDA